jgi:hypothetical protein
MLDTRCAVRRASLLPSDCQMAGKPPGLLRMRDCAESALIERVPPHGQNAPIGALAAVAAAGALDTEIVHGTAKILRL